MNKIIHQSQTGDTEEPYTGTLLNLKFIQMEKGMFLDLCLAELHPKDEQSSPLMLASLIFIFESC